jgi:hypothetical protein
MNQTPSETEDVSSSPPLYSTHKDYGGLVAGAHRRRVTPIGGPALTRHLVFWNPVLSPKVKDVAAEPERRGPKKGAKDAEPLDIAQKRAILRKVQSDRLVTAIYRDLVDRQDDSIITDLRMTHPSAERTDEAVPLFGIWLSESNGAFGRKPNASSRSDSYRAIKIYFSWQGLPVSLSMELHVEFLTLTAVIDLSRPEADPAEEADPAPKTGPAPKADPAEVCADFPDLRDPIRKICGLYDAGETDESKWRDLHRFVYYDVWDSLDKIIFASPGTAILKKTPGVADPERFVDFRGLILSIDADRKPAPAADGSRDREIRRSEVPAPLRAPFCRKPTEGTGNERKAVCGSHDFDRIWPFLKSGFDDENTEFTLSRYLDGRAMFATALAEQREMVAKPGSGPLCYLILEDTLNTWQLGRLVYRMHRAGTARVAAMMHFEQIKRADEILARVEHRLETSLDSTTELAEPSEELENQARDALRVSNREIEKELRRIAALDLDGSLDYRIERSRYYVSQFDRITKSLRIKRVQGFQTYVEFVQQRLSPLFEYIDRIGQRHARVQGDRGLLLRRIHSLEALYEERFISRTQRVADGALYGILGPYYLISIIDHAEWFDGAFLGRAGLLYSLFYLILLAWKPNRPAPAGSGGLIARLRRPAPRRVGTRLSIALALALILGTASHLGKLPWPHWAPPPDWLKPIFKAEPGEEPRNQAAIEHGSASAVSSPASSSANSRHATASPRLAL